MTTSINSEETKRLATLARLSVPEAELESVSNDIGNILGFIDTIQSVQLGDTTTENSDKKNVFREDVVRPLVPAHDLVEAAPLHQDHFVKVPKVLE